MAIGVYAVSERATVLEKINVWGRMVLLVIVTSLGTETVVASNPQAAPMPFDQRQTLSEPGDGMGFADSSLHLHQEQQRWVF